MANTWFTSDEHYDHRNIILYSRRPFADVDEMQKELIARHNSVVQKNDTVYHVGDFALDERTVPKILPQLNGTHYLISGNHDRCHACHKKHEKAQRDYRLYGFAGVYQELHLGKFLINHLPYTGDSQHEARYPEHRPKDEGKVLLHGHIHELWKVNGRMINVGVDVWNYTPVNIKELETLA